MRAEARSCLRDDHLIAKSAAATRASTICLRYVLAQACAQHAPRVPRALIYLRDADANNDMLRSINIVVAAARLRPLFARFAAHA